MTRYLLPDILGGIEVEDVGDQVHGLSVGVKTLMENVTVEVPGVGLCQIPRNKLTLVEPALPQEPPVRAVVLDRDGDAWIRNAADDKPWACFELSADWAHLNNKYGPLVHMVPDPAANVELPFALGSCARSAMVTVLDGGRVSLAIETEWYAPDEAERIGAAILRAAREARSS